MKSPSSPLPANSPAQRRGPESPPRVPAAVTAREGGGRRRRQLHCLTALLLALAAALGLAGGGPYQWIRPEAANPADRPGVVGAVYRADGGQSLSPSGPLEPNQLSELNLGRAINLKSARPDLLARLPSLGPGSAIRAVESGCLNKRQQKTLDGLISETCDRNNH